MTEFTTFDLLSLGTILGCVVISVLRGLVGEVFSFASFIVALLAAKIFSVQVADLVFPNMNPREIGVVFAFVITYVVARVAVALIREVLEMFVKKAHLSSINRIAGGALGAAKGVIMVSIGTLACSFSDLPSTPEWKNAMTSSFFESTASLGKPYLPLFLARQIEFKHDEETKSEGKLKSAPLLKKKSSAKPAAEFQ
ncbi:CvpA family protein [Kingella negevensis]|uniref:Colicin V production protein n=1 Tax=Kingella negevensis TaxID=1522312 RepID=A0A238HE54_9NEIS|nr:CvpA family protein [Kingella negevensis]MDK4680060.1 CvpA family protein [Kingella negevensis]MDK4682220.1 CvpA family protein [Kingella negevensis]MDK4684367.1 CvpA family protein [Kingella negevensis]MDK4690417.1 CvpA family protein [Kingella negevensis]MDK4692234.1 CvpA family protein [Kingella negevensis]